MIKLIRFFSLCLVAVCLIIHTANAQLAAGASFDFSGEAGGTIQNIQQKITSFQEQVVAKVKKNVTKIKAGLEKYAGKINKLLGKIPGVKDADEGGSVDIYSAEAVQTAFKELFLQYPSTDSRINTAYEKMGVNLYYDTLVEVRTAITGLEDKLASLRSEVEQFGEQAINPNAGGDTADPEDESAIYYNAYLANRKFNDILKITEEVVAMQNQYFAVRNLRQPRAILPARAPAESTTPEKTSSSIISIHNKFAFAQQLKIKKAISKAASNIKDKVVKKVVKKAPEITTNKIESKTDDMFVVAETPKASALLGGNEAELASLSKISEIQKILTDALDIHNVLQQLPSYKYLYKQHELYKRLHVEAVKAVGQADKCVLQYLGRRYEDPNTVWYGQKYAPSNTCDYDNRKGLSGWTINLFQVSNAALSSGLDVDAFAEIDVDSSQGPATASSTEINLEEKEANNDSSKSSHVFASPSKEKEFSDSVREIELLNWQIGRKAAQLLAADQYSEKPIYGKAKNPYPLWNDQRAYYDQYIDGKYENMKTYIRYIDVNSIAIGLVELLNNGEEESEGKQRNSEAIGIMENAISSSSTTNSRAMELLSQKSDDLLGLQKKQAKVLEPYETRLAELQQQLDAWTKMINDTNEEINEVDEEALQNKTKMDSSYNQMEIMHDKGMTTGSTYALAKHTMEESGSAYSENIDTLGRLRVNVKRFENARDKVQEQINLLQEEIDEQKQAQQNEISELELDYETRIAELQNSLGEVKKLSSYYRNLKSKYKKWTLSSLVNKADNIVEKARDCAIELVEEHREAIKAMAVNDVLYMTYNNPIVVQKHSTLISDLKKLPADCLRKTASSAIGTLNVNASDVISIARSLFKSAIVKSICSNYDCEKADTQYFVGVPAKPGDFTAPKAPLTANYAPVRDIVHLDTTDFKKIEMANKKNKLSSNYGKISKSAFLNYGVEMPYVWQLMLSDKAYVEKGMNLSAALSRGGEDKAFMQGTMLPCRVGRYMLDVKLRSNNNVKYSVVDTTKPDNATSSNIKKLNSLPYCSDLRIANAITLRVEDIDVDKKIDGASDDKLTSVNPSELGMFLRYTNGRLYINSRPLYGYMMLIDKEKKAEKKGKYELSAEDNIYNRAMFTTNQIGEFLTFVDKENNIRKNIEEIEAGMDEVKEDLKVLFNEMGFELKNNLNLANDNDYKYVFNKLKERKNTLVSQASEGLGTIVQGNDMVKERFDKVDNTYKALIQDSTALVNLTFRTKSGSKLTESIKSEKANQKVIEKSRNEGYSAIEKEIKNYKQPVCMPY
ncbi:MAG: hypothetical protein IJZ59_03905 [Alphaproteobacteria bacterium]|nr:hypothetical protein [Alphaproteobacteria bacterium]